MGNIKKHRDLTKKLKGLFKSIQLRDNSYSVGKDKQVAPKNHLRACKRAFLKYGKVGLYEYLKKEPCNQEKLKKILKLPKN